MDLITTLITATVLAVFGSVTTYLTNRWIDGWRKKDAFKRLQDEPTVYPGAKLARIVDNSSGAVLMKDCRVTALEVGRMVVRSIVTDEVMTFTGREFEKLHVVVRGKAGGPNQ